MATPTTNTSPSNKPTRTTVRKWMAERGMVFCSSSKCGTHCSVHAIAKDVPAALAMLRKAGFKASQSFGEIVPDWRYPNRDINNIVKVTFDE